MTAMKEYDFYIKPTTIVRGQALCKLAAEAQDQDDKAGWENEASMYTADVLFIPTDMDSWYYDLKYYLQHGSSPNHLDANNNRALIL